MLNPNLKANLTYLSCFRGNETCRRGEIALSPPDSTVNSFYIKQNSAGADDDKNKRLSAYRDVYAIIM